MTRALLTQAGSNFTVAAYGHATGSVEVCASISTLFYTLAGWLHNVDAKITEERLEDGDAVLSFSGGPQVETAFDLITIGFLQLQNTEPTKITVDFKIF